MYIIISIVLFALICYFFPIRKIFMGIILAIIAVILFCVVFPIGIFCTLFSVLYKRKWKNALEKINKQFLSIATSIDCSGNVVGADFFNYTFRTKDGYAFGRRKETISSALGKNERDGTLTKVGLFVCNSLNFFEKKHCFISIDDLV